MQGTPAFGATSTGLKTATAQITTMPGSLVNILVDPPSSGVATLTVYDSDAAATTSGTELFYAEIAAGTDTPGGLLNFPITVNKGIYAVFSGTGSSYLLHYTLG